jgi:hypothetical protein
LQALELPAKVSSAPLQVHEFPFNVRRRDLPLTDSLIERRLVRLLGQCALLVLADGLGFTG